MTRNFGHSGWLKSPIGGAFAGLMVGIVLVGVLIALDIPESSHGSSAMGGVIKSNKHRDGDKKASLAFVEAWERKFAGVYLVEGEFIRTSSSGDSVSYEVITAQLPPNSVQVGVSQVVSTIDGQRVSCPLSEVDGNVTTQRRMSEDEVQADQRSNGRFVPRCRRPVPVDVEAETQADLAAVEKLVVGANAYYSVLQRRDGCFELRASQIEGRPAIQLSSLQWGNSAVFCFDDQTGAISSSRIFRDGGTDVTSAKSIRGSVTQADLDSLKARHSHS